MSQLSAEQIAKTTGGEIIGDQNKTISSVAKLDEATSEDLAFFANPKYENQVYDSKCGILFVPDNFNCSCPAGDTKESAHHRMVTCAPGGNVLV